MSRAAITIEGLGKKYFTGGPRKAGGTLRDALQEIGASLRGGAFKTNRTRPDRNADFWALRDVSFEVPQGQVLGVIGENGSGKSTLLKILAHVTKPSAGWVSLRGRLGSLLEVGTGFHPELTGRENVYLNGAIIGMDKAEINRKFDAIVAFSGVEKFLDTPVKRYSSGMQVRLAFSVAAHLEPEILLLDEVMAVGDIVFQKKSMRRMKEIARQGRTVLLVSHSMDFITSFCDRAVLLEQGRLIADGPPDEVCAKHLELVDEFVDKGFDVFDVNDIPGVIKTLEPDPVFRLLDAAVTQGDAPTLALGAGRPVDIHFVYEVTRDIEGLYLHFSLLDAKGTLLFESISDGDQPAPTTIRAGRYVSRARIPKDFLAHGLHEISVGAYIHGVRPCMNDTLKLHVTIARDGLYNQAYPKRRVAGLIAPVLDWIHDELSICDEGENGSFKAGDYRAWSRERAAKEFKPRPEVVFTHTEAQGGVRLHRVAILNQQGLVASSIPFHESFFVMFHYSLERHIPDFRVGFKMLNAQGLVVMHAASCDDSEAYRHGAHIGEHEFHAKVPGSLLAPQPYHFDVAAASPTYGHYYHARHALTIVIEGPGPEFIHDEILRPVLPWCSSRLGTKGGPH